MRKYHTVVDKAGRGSYRCAKSQYGIETSAPEPQMDWDMLRQFKRRCEDECLLFNEMIGGCLLGLLPSAECPELVKRL